MHKIIGDTKIYFLLLIAIIGGGITYYFNHQLNIYEESRRTINLENTHQVAVEKFRESINRFAYLMSGMQSHLRHADTFPSQEKLQEFLLYQINQLNIRDSLIVSFLNTDHQFLYSFTADEIDPGNLIGTSVRKFRDNSQIELLENMLQGDEMKLFPPINLVEGWVGIPLNFPVIRDARLEGYIASIINFKNIIEPIYKLEQSNQFAFQFSVKNGDYFDRERVHDKNKVYHHRSDERFFKNYDIPEGNFIRSDVTIHGLTFEIGTAYIADKFPNPYLRWTLLTAYILIFLFAGYAIYRYQRYRQLNEKLITTNNLMNIQNQELNDLNTTKNRLMSIVGHDLKGPISSIINLINLLEDSAISLSDAKKILKQLNPTAKTTINLLENLLQWGMLNSNQTLFKLELIPVKKVVEENFTLLSSLSDQKEIELINDVPTSLNVFADANMFSTIMRNLVSNAIKYSDKRSPVRVTGFSEGLLTTIQVIDQGIGMTEIEINSVLNTELDVSKKGTAGEKGTGLGLTLCKAFLEKNNGALKIESKKNKGSIFIVILPTSYL